MPAGYVIDYTGGSRQLRIEGDKFLPRVFMSRRRSDFSGSGRAVQQLPRSAYHSVRFSSARAFRRAASSCS